MKHMKINLPQEICAFPRIRTEVFTEDSQTLCVLRSNLFRGILQYMKDGLKEEGYTVRRNTFTVDTTGTYCKVKLSDKYHFEYNLDSEEIILVAGYESISIVNELGEPVAHDYDIDMF